MNPAALVGVGLVIGAVLGGGGVYALQPGTPLAPVVQGPEIPTEQQANEAMRRFKTVGGMSFPEATLKLGQCSESAQTPGVLCMTEVQIRSNTPPQKRPIGFAKLGNDWEVSLW